MGYVRGLALFLTFFLHVLAIGNLPPLQLDPLPQLTDPVAITLLSTVQGLRTAVEKHYGDASSMHSTPFQTQLVDVMTAQLNQLQRDITEYSKHIDYAGRIERDILANRVVPNLMTSSSSSPSRATPSFAGLVLYPGQYSNLDCHLSCSGLAQYRNLCGLRTFSPPQ